MICNVCNKEVENGANACPYCGSELVKKDSRVIEISFKKPDPPPVIELSFIEPVCKEPVYEEVEESVYEEPIYEEPVYEEPVYEAPAPAPKPVKKKKPSKEKPEKPKKVAKDKVNPLFFLISLLWAPYPGVLLWVATSKKTPKASCTYGICGIIMFVLKCIKQYVTSIVTRALAVIFLLIMLAGATAVVLITQYNITF